MSLYAFGIDGPTIEAAYEAVPGAIATFMGQYATQVAAEEDAFDYFTANGGDFSGGPGQYATTNVRYAKVSVWNGTNYTYRLWAYPGPTGYWIPDTIEPPVILPDSGTFANPISVSISCATVDAEIYYTLDGTTPTVGSTRYLSSFVLTSSKTVKAISRKEALTSGVVTEIYVILYSGAGGRDRSWLKRPYEAECKMMNVYEEKGYEDASPAALAFASGNPTEIEVGVETSFTLEGGKPPYFWMSLETDITFTKSVTMNTIGKATLSSGGVGDKVMILAYDSVGALAGVEVTVSS